MNCRTCGIKAAFFSALTLLAACGGNGDGSNSQPTDGSFPPNAVTLLITILSENEPNNSLAEADAHTFPELGQEADYVGFGIGGAVHDTVDPADYFVFTPSRAHTFTIQMCSYVAGRVLSCGPNPGVEIIDTSVAYFEVQDQDGVLLLSSQGDFAAGNVQEIYLSAGVAYYLAVFAEDTVDTFANYEIVTFEKIPFL
jgi:hypothetical protein